MEKSRPKITISSAISIDGKISSKSNDSKLSSNEDLKRLHKLRSVYDAILVGKNTVLKDNPLLTVRFTKGKNPIRIILDSRGEIPKESKILITSKKCCEPPSGKSSLSTDVITTCLRFNFLTALDIL